MKLAHIPQVADFLIKKQPDLKFKQVQCDSRRVEPGDLFVALTGSRESGARYAADALARGAVAVMAEAPIPGLSRQTILVSDARAALACMAAAVQGWPSHAMRVYGVTGTNGKTTTTSLLHRILQQGGLKVGMLTTVMVEYDGRTIPATRTTPDACELQATLATMRKAGCTAVVMEVSSHGIDQQRSAFTRFAGAAFTNLSRDHLDYHHDMHAYFQAKQRLFAQIAADTPGAMALCCLDAPYGAAMADYLSTLPLRRMTYGFTPQCDLRAESVQLMADGTIFTLALPDGTRRTLHTHLAGRYNIANMLCAAGLALDAAITLDDIVVSLETARPQWGRLERIETASPAALFVDYAHTDDALRNVLVTLREVTHGRLTVVFGCGGERDRTKRPIMGSVCAELADALVITSDNPRSENPMNIIAEILTGVPTGTNVMVESDRRAAIRAALTNAHSGDVILLAGKGHEVFQEIAGRAISFDDRIVAREEAERLAHVN